jgi:uncharacterized integral membrane protein
VFLSRFFSAIKFWLSIGVTLLLLLFSIVNREFIDISLFPLPYDFSLPKFLLVIICFGLGLLVGGMLMSCKYTRAKRNLSREHERTAALENEVKSLHSQQHVLSR